MITLAHVIYALHAFSALTGPRVSVLVLTGFSRAAVDHA